MKYALNCHPLLWYIFWFIYRGHGKHDEPNSKSSLRAKPHRSPSVTKSKTNINYQNLQVEPRKNLHQRRSKSPITSHSRKCKSPLMSQQSSGNNSKLSTSRANKSVLSPHRRRRSKSPERNYSLSSTSPRKYNSRTKSPCSSGVASQVWRLKVDDKMQSKRYFLLSDEFYLWSVLPI